jgi:membrane-bound lytic murein transglycosylase A
VLDWQDLEGWKEDRLTEAWPALLQNCAALSQKQDQWRKLCAQVASVDGASADQVRNFFEANFHVREIYPEKDESQDGLITGYYEPLLFGASNPSERYRYPVYKRPEDLLIVDLSELYPELKGKRVRARMVDGNRVVPYFDRATIDGNNSPLQGNEIAWVDDVVGLFFTQIQGSAKIQLEDGRQIDIGYADQNGHPYYAIGRKLIEMEEISKEKMSMQAIQQWLQDHPQQANELLNQNPSYIFFTERESQPGLGPLGSLGVPLTAKRSVAVDRKAIPLGSALWLNTKLPEADAKLKSDQALEFRHLVFAQDTGGAISGRVRADLFWGNGPEAEYYAGVMRQPGRIFLLVPNESQTIE